MDKQLTQHIHTLGQAVLDSVIPNAVYAAVLSMGMLIAVMKLWGTESKKRIKQKEY